MSVIKIHLDREQVEALLDKLRQENRESLEKLQAYKNNWLGRLLLPDNYEEMLISSCEFNNLVARNLAEQLAGMESQDKGPFCCYTYPSDDDVALVHCTNKPEYEVWFGVRPKHEDYTHVCAAHLEKILDDNVQFTVVRLVAKQ